MFTSLCSAAEIRADQIVINANAYAAKTVAFAWVEYNDHVGSANVAHHEKVANATASVAEFLAAVGADNAYYCPENGCAELLVPDENGEKHHCPKCGAEHDTEALVTASAEYRYYKYIKALSLAYSGAKLIIVGDGVNMENIYIGNISGAN